MKAAFLTGITGQDGSYLTELLLEKGYKVWGMIRRSSLINTKRIDHLYHHPQLFLRYGDLTDSCSIMNILQEIKQSLLSITCLEIYNLGAMSHVKVSFDMPIYTGEVDGLGTLRILEAIRQLHLESITKFYQASTSELYGKVQEVPQTEMTPFYPRSPYGVAKLYSYWIVKNYRESYGMFASNGILFNHESSRRGDTFVTKKITNAVKKIISGKQDSLILGNLDAKRDWGHAKDFVYGMWLMLQQETPDDYVLSTNLQYSVREFVEKAFAYHNIDIQWKGEGLQEIGYDKKTGKELVFISETYYRPAEVESLLGDSTKARTQLGWNPHYNLDSLLEEMMEN